MPRDGKPAAATVRALARVRAGKCSAYRAAKDARIALSTIYRALARQRVKWKS